MIIFPLSHLPSQNRYLNYWNRPRKEAPDLRLVSQKQGLLPDPRAASFPPATSVGVGDGKLIWLTNNNHPQSVRLLNL